MTDTPGEKPRINGAESFVRPAYTICRKSLGNPNILKKAICRALRDHIWGIDLTLRYGIGLSMPEITIPPKLYGQLLRGNKTRWLRVKDLPFSRGHVYRLLAEDILFSVEVKLPGSNRCVRLIDAESLDKYLVKEGRRQQAAAAAGRNQTSTTKP